MLYALDDTGGRILPTKGAHGTCALCGEPVTAKAGELKVAHWSHLAGRNKCDPWEEQPTKWHRSWQDRADPDCCEVVMPPHRADIRRRDGLTIELQHSHIKPEDVLARQQFYGNMIWLFDGTAESWKNFHVRSTGGMSFEYSRLPRWDAFRKVARPFYVDRRKYVLRIERPSAHGQIWSGFGTAMTRAEFIEFAQLRPMSAEEFAELAKPTSAS